MQKPTHNFLCTIRVAALVLASLVPVACSKDNGPTAPSPVSNSSAPPSPAPATGPTDTEVQSLINLVNNRRISKGLAPLVWDDRVAAVALAHSQDMVDRHYYGHINPDGENAGDRLDEAGYGWSWWGENYCYGFSTATTAYNFWINSAPHQANIESGNFTHHGVGRVGSVWTHVFTKPRTTTSVEIP
jgi:uncharacterized protein YkwD